MMRFVTYAINHNRKIRMIYLRDNKIYAKTVTVLAQNDEGITVQISAKKPAIVLALADILSCDYARGDHGEE